MDDPELLDLVELEVRELLTKYEFSGGHHSDHPRERDEGAGVRLREGRVSGLQVRSRADGGGGQLHSAAGLRAVDKPFLMAIEDVFSISGRGTVVTGRFERRGGEGRGRGGSIGLRETQKTVATGVRCSGSMLDQGQAGDNIGVLLRGTKKDEVERGQVLAKRGRSLRTRKFKASAYILTKEEGGRLTPFFNGYRPPVYFRTTDVTGVATLQEGVEMVIARGHVQMTVELITPVAMEKELRFAIREGRAHRGRRRRRGHHRVAV